MSLYSERITKRFLTCISTIICTGDCFKKLLKQHLCQAWYM